MLFNTTCLRLLVGSSICQAGIEGTNESELSFFLNNNFPTWMNCTVFPEKTPEPTMVATPKQTPVESPLQTPELTPTLAPTPLATPLATPGFDAVCYLNPEGPGDWSSFFGQEPVLISGNFVDVLKPTDPNVHIFKSYFTQLLDSSGVIYCDNFYGKLLITFCSFTDCAFNDSIGAIYLLNDYNNINIGSSCFCRCYPSSNTHSTYSIYLGQATIMQCAIVNSSCLRIAGGMVIGLNHTTCSSATVRLLEARGATMVDNSQFINNIATMLTGALFEVSGYESYLMISNSNIVSNAEKYCFMTRFDCDFGIVSSVVKNNQANCMFASLGSSVRRVFCENCQIPWDQRTSDLVVSFINCTL